MGPEIGNRETQGELTAKQREALNLLIQHMTSKEMSRILGVSPHTVDQRIESAKRKFGVATRGELAIAYRRSLPVGERLTYEESHLAQGLFFRASSASDEPTRSDPLLDPIWTDQSEQEVIKGRYRIGPGLLFGPLGSIYRLAAIALIAFVLVFLVLGGISIFVSLTEILDR
jgi:DNA-binding CsgD family transcriptional regulator